MGSTPYFLPQYHSKFVHPSVAHISQQLAEIGHMVMYKQIRHTECVEHVKNRNSRSNPLSGNCLTHLTTIISKPLNHKCPIHYALPPDCFGVGAPPLDTICMDNISIDYIHIHSVRVTEIANCIIHNSSQMRSTNMIV